MNHEKPNDLGWDDSEAVENIGKLIVQVHRRLFERSNGEPGPHALEPVIASLALTACVNVLKAHGVSEESLHELVKIGLVGDATKDGPTKDGST